MKSTGFGKIITRLWYYFRIGYGTYLTFIIGIVSTAVVVYYLLVKSVPSLQFLFRSFTDFLVIATLVGVPLSIMVGWLHLKGSSAMVSEQDIMLEANPYAYKLQPGYLREAFAPLYLETLRLLKTIASNQHLLTEDEKRHIDDLEVKMEKLIQGGYVGTPRRRPLSE